MKFSFSLLLPLLLSFSACGQVKNLSDAQKQKFFNGHQVVLQNNTVISTYTHGLADIENNTAINDSTLFNISSIGKLFTRIAILQLVQENKLSLDATLKSLGIDLAGEAENEVTVKHLLTHRSGLYDYYDSKEYKQDRSKFIFISDIMKLVQKEEIKFKPGSEAKYSNSGYIILGFIVEKLSGKTFEQYLKEKVFAPLRMEHTLFLYNHTPVQNRAWGYKGSSLARAKKVWAKETQEEPTSVGNMYSTIGDLVKIAQSLLGDEKLLNDIHKAVLFNNFETTEPDFKKVQSTKAVAGYVGSNPGWSAKISFLLSSGYTIITLCNFEEMAEEADERIRNEIKK